MLLRAFQLCSRRSRSVVAEESLINQMTDDSVDGIDKFQESSVSSIVLQISRNCPEFIPWIIQILMGFPSSFLGLSNAGIRNWHPFSGSFISLGNPERIMSRPGQVLRVPIYPQ